MHKDFQSYVMLAAPNGPGHASCCKHSADFAHRNIESMQQIVVNIQLLLLSQQILANFRVNLCSKSWWNRQPGCKLLQFVASCCKLLQESRARGRATVTALRSFILVVRQPLHPIYIFYFRYSIYVISNMTHPLRNIPAVSVFSFTWIFLIYQTINIYC